LASPRLQLYKHDLEGLIAQIFRQVFSRRDKHGLPRLRRELFCLSIGKSKFSTGVGEEHRDACGMSVHDGFLVRAVADPQDPHLVILELDGVVLGIDLHRVLCHGMPPLDALAVVCQQKNRTGLSGDGEIVHICSGISVSAYDQACAGAGAVRVSEPHPRDRA
jgi:hypothetical protein